MMSDIATLNVAWRGQTADVPISGTISDMITASCNALSPLIEIESARIVFRSHSYTIVVSPPAAKGSDDAVILASTVFTGNHPHALLFASARGESAALVAAADINTRIRDDLGGGGANSIRVSHALPSRRRRRPLGTVPYPEPGFGCLQPLPNFDDRNALRFLRAVASHPGVIAVMRARSWHVETLAEMPAKGLVGVDPVCVLGLNESNGGKTFRISLRLRTDDLSDHNIGGGSGGGGGGIRSFRKYATVMETVWHELAHCAISEHSAAFYALVSVLKKEGEAADWRVGPQHVLGGDGAGEVAWQTIDDETDDEEEGIVLPFSGHGERLGGVEIVKEERGGGMAERAAVAAETRILAAATVAEVVVEEVVPKTTLPPVVATPVAEVVVPAKISLPVPPSITSNVPKSTTHDITSPAIDPLEPGRLRTERLRNDLARVRADATVAGVDSALAITTLRNIVERAARGEDPRHLSIRKDNQILAQRTGGSIAAIHFLLGAGFITSISDNVVWLRVNDQAALWLAKAVAEEES
jgi:hypothetical protein